jgi:hypothetical protein
MLSTTVVVRWLMWFSQRMLSVMLISVIWNVRSLQFLTLRWKQSGVFLLWQVCLLYMKPYIL